jgi:Ca2+-binding EF-hand superfamily protein
MSEYTDGPDRPPIKKDLTEEELKFGFLLIDLNGDGLISW